MPFAPGRRKVYYMLSAKSVVNRSTRTAPAFGEVRNAVERTRFERCGRNSDLSLACHCTGQESRIARLWRMESDVDATKAFLRKIEETAITTLEHVRNRHFKNERIEIDGKRFTSCTFDGCELIYAGGDVEFGSGCSVENCRPEFSGPARRTVLLLHSLGLLSFNPLDGQAKKRSA